MHSAQEGFPHEHRPENEAVFCLLLKGRHQILEKGKKKPQVISIMFWPIEGQWIELN